MKLGKDTWTWKNPRLWVLAVILPILATLWIDNIRLIRAARQTPAPPPIAAAMPVADATPVTGLPAPLPDEPYAWDADPFAWRPEGVAVAPPPDAPDPDLSGYRPEAILYSASAGSGLAVINGERVRVGEPLIAGVIVRAIRADHVEVQVEHSGNVYRLALKD